ncbi:MAG: LacI family DNA-binding transcriptional regulator [Anaerolineae bacterium]|nr:LacI family DNA-binding transcriptional regulator [Anaerolineae bacterium]
MPRRVTMSDVAQKAGVSLMTVSRVINDKGEVSEETIERVQKVIQELGYRPSGIARSLAGGQTYTIGLIVPDIANPYFSGIAHGVAKVAYSEGFGVLLCDCEEKPERELAMLDVLEEKRVDGVVVAAPRSATDQLLPVLDRHPNAVIVNRLFDKSSISPAVGYVINDDKTGGYLITKCFLDRGHTVIGFLAGPQTSYGSQRRHLGYRFALEEHKLEYRPELILYCPPTVAGGREAARQLIQEHPEVSAIFCFNDLVAIGSLQCCHQLGFEVPNDIAIIGYDDIPMASWVTPALSTCRVTFEEMGSLATQLLINHISECSENCENIVLAPELILRASAP